jgi:hypothetical protein
LIKNESENNENNENSENDDDEEKIDYFVLIQESKDYPFTRWENYFNAFAQFLSSDCVDAPKYSEIRDKDGVSIDNQIIDELLEKDRENYHENNSF